MKTTILIIVEIVVFCVLSIICKKVRNYQFYEAFLKTKYPLYDLISIKEKIAYRITKLVIDAPSFSFVPTDYEFRSKEYEKSTINKKGEKIWIDISLIFMYVRSVVGNIIIDIVLIITFLTCQNIINLGDIWNSIIVFFRDISYDVIGNDIKNVLQWIQDNVNVILVLLLVIISFYTGSLKRKKRKYTIEAVWAEEEKDRIKEIAKIQKIIESKLLDIRGDIYQNLVVLQEWIRNFSCIKDDRFDRLIDYSNKTKELKELLRQIADKGGIQIYAKRNRKLYVQLALLDLLPTLAKEDHFCNFEYLSKEHFHNSDLSESDLSESALCKKYARGVALINGINRFLKFSYKKRNQYNRIVLHIADYDLLGDVVGKIK